MRRQCELLGIHRSGVYYAPVPVGIRELELRRRLDRIYTAHPEYGVRRMVLGMREEGLVVNPKCVRRLLREMGLEAVYPKPRLRQPGAGAGRFPYLLRGVRIERPGRRTSPTLRWRGDGLIWWRFWSGTVATCWPGE